MSVSQCPRRSSASNVVESDRGTIGPAAPVTNRLAQPVLSPPPKYQRVVRHDLHCRQFDMSGTVEHQQQATANHIAQRAVGLLPLPGFTQFLRQPAAARSRICRDQFPDMEDIFRGDHPSPVFEFRH